VTIAGIPQPCAVLHAAVAGVGLHVDTTAYVIYSFFFALFAANTVIINSYTLYHLIIFTLPPYGCKVV